MDTFGVDVVASERWVEEREKKEGLERSFYVKTGIGVQDATVNW
jgi:hypothetical protein